MAESFLFSIVGKLLGELGSPLLQEAKLVYCVPSELEKLIATLTAIQAVLLDAEEQQAKTHGAAEHQEMRNQLTDWLRKLKDLVYQIDDVLDDFKIVDLQRQVMRRSIKRREEEDIQFQDGGLRSLGALEIVGVPKLVAMPTWLLQGATALKHISIHDCPNFKTLMADSLLENLTSLQRLVIRKCPQLTSLPEGMRSLTMLREIWIEDCPELAKSCQEGDDRYKIAHVPNIYLDHIKFQT